MLVDDCCRKIDESEEADNLKVKERIRAEESTLEQMQEYHETDPAQWVVEHKAT
jgi:hypothetical protein